MLLKKQPALACPIDTIGSSSCPMAVFSGFYESPGPPPSGDVHRIVLLHRDDHRNGHQSGHIIHCCLFAIALAAAGVMQSGRPVASSVALDMLHRVMTHASLQCLTMAIEMACNGGAFVCRRRLFCLA